MKTHTGLLFSLLLPFGAKAATAIEYAGSVSGEEVTGWRNMEILKTRDKDGDNRYGTTGSVIWTVAGNREGADPGWGFGGGAGGGAITQVPGEVEIDNFDATGAALAGAQTGGFRFRMTGAEGGYFGKSVRVGIMLDVLAASVVHPQTIQITSDDGSLDSTVIQVAAADGVPDMYFFDITEVLPGENFDVTVTAEDGEGNALDPGIGPVSWDLFNTPSTGAPPVIGAQPQSLTVVEGGRAVLSVTAAPLDGLAYQWKKDGIDIPGAASAVYALDPATPATGGVFTCVVTNAGGSVTSDGAVVAFEPPASRSANYKAAVEAEVSLIGYFPVDGSTGETVANTRNPGAGGALSGGAGIGSEPGRVLGNRGFLGAPGGLLALTKDAAWDFADDESGTVEAFLHMAGAVGHNPAWFAVRDADGVRYSLHVSGGGNSLILWNGSAATVWPTPEPLLETLAHVAIVFEEGTVTAYLNSQSLGTQTSGLGFGVDLPAQAGASTPGGAEAFPGVIDELAIYSAALGAQAVAAHYEAWSGVAPAPPEILEQPRSVTVVENGTAVFSVAAAIPASVSYQWQRNNVNLPGAESAELIVSPASAAENGAAFRCLVTNSFGTTTSEAAVLTTVPPAPNSAAYQAAVKAEPSLLAYFPVDGSAAPAVNNEKAPEYGGEYGNGGMPASLAEQTIGAAAMYGRNGGAVLLNKDPAWDFADDNSGTVEAFVFQEEARGYNPAWFAIRGPGGVRYSLHTDSAGANLWIWNGSAAVSFPVPESTIGRLCHVAVVFRQDAEAGLDIAECYLNGELIGASETYPLGAGLDLPAQIGAALPNFAEAFPGSIDELAIYSDPLSAERIAAHYAAWTGGGGTPAALPVITSITHSPATGVSLTFTTATGPAYQVHSSTDLEIWTPVGTARTGDGAPLTVTDPAATAGKRFYRVRVQQAP